MKASICRRLFVLRNSSVERDVVVLQSINMKLPRKRRECLITSVTISLVIDIVVAN